MHRRVFLLMGLAPFCFQCDKSCSIIDFLSQIRIYTSDKKVAIDAVELVSTTNFPECTKRKSPKYKIERDPPLPGGAVLTEDTEFKDM